MQRVSPRSEPRGRQTLPGRIFSALFGLVFVTFGLGFTGVALWSLLVPDPPRGWPAALGTIRATTLVPNEVAKGGFKAVIEYTFERPGGLRTASHIHEDRDYSSLVALLKRYPLGSEMEGRRNPETGEVRLISQESRRSQILLLPFLLIPGFFVIVGSTVVLDAIRGNKPATASGSRKGFGRAGGVAFGSAFVFIGSIGLWVVLIQPAWRLIQARSWPPVPCEIELSRVITSRGSKGGTSYRPETLYHYQIDGRTHRSSRISFVDTGGSTRSHTFVGHHPVGTRTNCHVNPKDPDEAVLDRQPSWSMAIALVILLFPLAGLWVIRFSLKKD
jgi:hypothetical protein